MSQDDDAHFLHERRGLEALVKPPVGRPVALAWTGKGDLLAASADGTIDRVHPALGTSRVLSDLGPLAGLGVDGDRFVVVERTGRWSAHDARGQRLVEGQHPFEGSVQVAFRGDRVVLTGLTKGEKQALFFENGRKVLRVQLPARGVAFVTERGLGLAQSTPTGLEVVWLEEGGRFQGREATGHQLVAHGDRIVGLHGGGVRVWRLDTPVGVDVPVPGTTSAALTHEGGVLAVGTSEGAIALVDLGDPAAIAQPTLLEATDTPVRALAFSRKGRFLASGADQLVLWTWT